MKHILFDNAKIWKNKVKNPRTVARMYLKHSSVMFWETLDYIFRVLARPKRQGAAPCRFPSAPCRFFSALSFSENPLVSLGFHQRYFELEVAESVQLRRKVARFLCITLLFASDIAAILDLR